MMRYAALLVTCGLLAGGCLRPEALCGDRLAVGRLFDGETLGCWQPADFLFTGDVHVENGRIVLERGNELTGIRWTGPVLRTDYEISLEAMRVAGEDFFCGLTFPVGEDYCTLIVGGWHGKLVGLSSIDLMDASENDTTMLLDFEQNRWYPIRLRVTTERITAWIDDDKVVDADIAGRIITIRGSVEPCRPLGVATWLTTGALRNITVRPIEAEQAAESSAGDSSK